MIFCHAVLCVTNRGARVPKESSVFAQGTIRAGLHALVALVHALNVVARLAPVFLYSCAYVASSLMCQVRWTRSGI